MIGVKPCLYSRNFVLTAINKEEIKLKIKIDLTARDLMELNDPETTQTIVAEAHAILDHIFEEKDNLIKCSITVDGDKE